MNHDYLQAIESVYRTDLENDDAWLGTLLDGLCPILDTGLGLMGMFVDASNPAAMRFSDPVGRNISEEMRTSVHNNIAELSLDMQRRSFVEPPKLVSTMSAVFGKAFIESSPVFAKTFRAGGLHDGLMLFAVDATGRGCVLSAGQPRVTSVPRTFRAPLERVAVHALTALRLRRALARGADPTEGEAVITPTGHIEHAVGDATERDALSALKEAAVAIDRARRLRKKDAAAATELWRGLASGRWSLVDRFDRDGRRYMVAIRNDPAGAPIRELTPREAQVVALVALGRPSKIIAYELGLSEPIVSRQLASAMSKLGARSRTALAERLAPAVSKS